MLLPFAFLRAAPLQRSGTSRRARLELAWKRSSYRRAMGEGLGKPGVRSQDRLFVGVWPYISKMVPTVKPRKEVKDNVARLGEWYPGALADSLRYH